MDETVPIHRTCLFLSDGWESVESPDALFLFSRETFYATRSIVTDSSTTGFWGLFPGPLATFEILSAMAWPSTTSPKMVCLQVSHSVGATVMKNWQPFVLGPLLAMANFPGFSK